MSSGLITYYLAGITATFLTATITYWLSLHFNKHAIPQKVFYILIGVSSYVFIAQYLKYETLNAYADLSHWLQVLNNISTSWIPKSLTHEFIFPGTINYFSVHFTPLIYLFVPIFSLIPSAKTLLVLQGLSMFSAIIPLYLLAKKHGDKIFALFAVTMFVWYPTFQYITMYEFEMLRFSIPILFWMIYFWEQKRLPLYFLFVFLATMVREEVGLTILMFGIYISFIEKKKLLGFITSALGLGAFFIIINSIIPSFSTASGATYLPSILFSKFGNTPFEIAQNVFVHPLLSMTTIFSHVKIANIGMLFLPLLLIPLLSPLTLVSILANLGTGLLSDAPEHTSYMLYYIAPSIPFIFYAFIKAWPRLIQLLEHYTKKLKPLKILDQHHLIGDNTALRNNIISSTMIATLSGVLIINIFFGPSPFSLQFWSKELRPAPFRTQNFHWSAYQITNHHKKVNDFIKLIPDYSIVSAEQFLAPRLFKKRGTMVFPQLESTDGKYKADYVFIDKSNPIKTGVNTVIGSWDGLRQNPQFYYDLVEKDTLRWELLKSDDGYELYKRIE